MPLVIVILAAIRIGFAGIQGKGNRIGGDFPLFSCFHRFLDITIGEAHTVVKKILVWSFYFVEAQVHLDKKSP
jgi:hypothetical protein